MEPRQLAAPQEPPQLAGPRPRRPPRCLPLMACAEAAAAGWLGARAALPAGWHWPGVPAASLRSKQRQLLLLRGPQRCTPQVPLQLQPTTNCRCHLPWSLAAPLQDLSVGGAAVARGLARRRKRLQQASSGWRRRGWGSSDAAISGSMLEGLAAAQSCSPIWHVTPMPAAAQHSSTSPSPWFG